MDFFVIQPERHQPFDGGHDSCVVMAGWLASRRTQRAASRPHYLITRNFVKVSLDFRVTTQPYPEILVAYLFTWVITCLIQNFRKICPCFQVTTQPCHFGSEPIPALALPAPVLFNITHPTLPVPHPLPSSESSSYAR